MAFDGDPYRTLGLARGASLDEVKRAYRRLAKANHPDAAGSAALTRFLAIQAAYEQLVEGASGPGASRRGPSRGAAGPTGAGGGPSGRASQADPDRAEATRRAYGGRTRDRARRPADGTPPGGRRQGSGSEARARPAASDDPGRADPESGRPRGKATLGSTSYDEAAGGPFDPDWSGASWYGTTSGTYWTINPKEYADPRKHGPEYQARARRATGPRPDPGGGEAAAETGVRPPNPNREPSSRWSATASPAEPTPGPAAADAGPATWRHVGERPLRADDEIPDPARALANLASALTNSRSGGLRGRAIRAFVGWLPVALGIGWLIGEATGCSRFAATCDPAIDPLTLLAQGAALVLLLLSPPLASLAASAALGMLVAALAATVILSAGTAADAASRRETLALLLVFGWLAGLAIAVSQRLRAVWSRAGPVS